MERHRDRPSLSPARLTLATVMSCAVWCAVTGCVSQDVANTVNERINKGFSTSELKIARDAALDHARKEDAKVTARATVSEADESASASGPPRPCTSGRLLHIILAGQFPNAEQSSSTPVSGQQLTVDATTGRVCEAHYLTGQIIVDPGSVLLFTNY